jgi:peroxiredoxin/mono/diheme cytochrome c family protein
MEMRRGQILRWGTLAAAVLSLGGVVTLSAAPHKMSTSKDRLTHFALKDTKGATRTLREFDNKRVIVLLFIGTECPMANSYMEPLAQMAGRYGAKGVQFLAVNANLDDDLDKVARHAKEYRIPFPVLKDSTQRVADQVGAQVTPEAFVFDSQRKIRYCGRIDDLYAARLQKRSAARSNDLQKAIDAVLAGKPVPDPVTEALGCMIVRPDKPGKTTARAGAPAYYKDVAPILQERCQSCHRPGQVAPFPLMTYAHAKSWAMEIKQFTRTRQMPPWKAEPGHGEFMDSRQLSEKEIATLGRWADAGAPAGNPKDAPTPKQWGDGWMLGKPDLVVTMPEPFQVEAWGRDDFRCFVLPTNLTEDKQVVGVEIRPGNPRVVHHVINFLDTSGKARELDQKDPKPGYSSGPGGIGFLPTGGLGGWAPGNFPRFLPNGVGMPLPKGSDLVVQLHYHKTGKPETDRTSIGIHFAKEPVEKKLRTIPLTNLGIDVPPGAARHEVKASMRLPFDIHAITVTPHMHLLGKEMKVTATLPDGKVKSLVWIKSWDYRWQDTYRYKEPVPLPKGTQLEMVAYYDNTSSNPLNPNNPPKRVTFGEETTDEMAFAFIGYILDKELPGSGGGLFGRLPSR